MEHRVNLDYSIDSSNERSSYIKEMYGDILHDLTGSELEAISNYILYPSQSRLTQREELALLDEIDYATKSVSKNFIQKKNAELNFDHPEMREIKKSIDKIKKMEEEATSVSERKRLRRWRSELVGDAHLFPGQDEGLFFEINRTNMSNSYAPTVSETVVDEKFDFTNEFHLRAFLIEYYNIQESYNMKPMLEFFDKLYYSTAMRPWERYLMELWKERDLHSNLDIQHMLYEKHGRIINQANYLNQVILRLCRSMVDTYFVIISEKHFANDRGKWKFCSSCGEWKLNTIGVWKQTGANQGCEVCRLSENNELGRYDISDHPFDPESKRKQEIFVAKKEEVRV